MKPNLCIFFVLLSSQLIRAQALMRGWCQSENEIPENCSLFNLKQRIHRATIGWPFRIYCYRLFLPNYSYNLAENSVDLLIQSTDVKCEIYNGENIVENITIGSYYDLQNGRNNNHLIKEVKQNEEYNFRVLLKSTESKICLYLNLALEAISFEEENCLLPIGRDEPLARRSVGEELRMFCSSTNTFLSSDEEDVDFLWKRNCSSVPAQLRSGEDSFSLLIPKIGFNLAGHYTCEATSKYNGLTTQISSTNLCVQPSPKFSNPSFSCRKTTLSKLEGEDAIFNCTAKFGGLVPERYTITYSTPKNAENFKECDTSPDERNEIFCSAESSRDTCYLYAPSVIPEQDVLRILFQIRDIRHSKDHSNFGNYMLQIEAEDYKERVQLSLEESRIDTLTSFASSVGAAVAVVCILLILLLFAIYNHFYVRAYYKRFFGAFVPDDKSYGACLIYTYSQDIDKFSKENLKTLIPMIGEMLENMGYSVYDEKRDNFIESSRAENVRVSIEKSHRVIIFLTSEFIKDEWNILALQTDVFNETSVFTKGFEDMIEMGSKLIFIVSPGMTEYLTQHESQNASFRMIQRAMKLNYVIKWSNKNKLNMKKVKLCLEMAMPKLKSQEKQRNDSNVMMI